MRKTQIVLALIVLFIVGAGVSALWAYGYWNGHWTKPENEVVVEISADSDAESIESILAEHGIIEKGLFSYWIVSDLRGLNGDILGGEYRFTGNDSRYEVIDKIATSQRYRHEIVIKGGMTQFEIADMLERMEIVGREAFLKACQEFSLFDFVVVTPPNNADPSIEGMLMPGTYYSVRQNEPRRMALRIGRRFNSEIQQLRDELDDSDQYWWQDPEVSESRQLHNIIVLASILEEEAKNPQDKAAIGAVLVNRLEQDMPLEAKSTIHFAIQDWDRNLTRDDYAVDSPYNTFTNKGLPPSALSNPDVDSIRAAMMPQDEDALEYRYSSNGALQLGS